MELHGSTIIYLIFLGVVMMLLYGINLYLHGLGLIIMTQFVETMGIVFFWVGLGLIIFFVIIFILEYEVI
ncbi:MAG: hypothetical protein ACFFCS_06635 [Candidatus Hodarchaeota archaeon]